MKVIEVLTIPECVPSLGSEYHYSFPCGLNVDRNFGDMENSIGNANIATEAHQWHHDQGHTNKAFTINCISASYEDADTHQLISAQCTCKE